jgi:hypothetical protein
VIRFNCRDLDGGLRVLIKDYSIRCSTSQHAAFELIAGAYVVCVSLGIPLYVRVSVSMFVRLLAIDRLVCFRWLY